MKKKFFDDNYNLTEAVLEGRKTMWRSVFDYETYRKLWEDMCRLGTPCFDTFDDFLIKSKARYKVGEVVAVAQRGGDIYRVLKKRFGETSDEALGFMKMCGGMPMWNNKMFTPASFCLSRIHITDIKVERLQDISEEDIIKEGITYIVGGYGVKFGVNDNIFALNPRAAFAALIDKVSGKGTWNRNPYVFAYTFELVK